MLKELRTLQGRTFTKEEAIEAINFILARTHENENEIIKEFIDMYIARQRA